MSHRHFDVGVIGAGSATEQLVHELDGSGLSIVVFEPDLVGGECPFRACMPSKSMLHDARSGTAWDDAVARRRRIADDLDDSGHADDLTDRGVELIRERAEILGQGRVVAAGLEYTVEHLVIATGATPIIPPIDGADECADGIWTSADALTSDLRPSSIVIVGAGVIGMECASLYARYGSTVTLIDNADRSFSEAPEAVGDIVEASLLRHGVDIRYGLEVSSIRLSSSDATDDGVVVTLSDNSEVSAERVLVSIGRRASIAGLGIERLGLDPDSPLPVDSNGKLRTEGSVWAMGDVAGSGQYTHLANHHARVIADHLVGTGTRRFDDVVVPRCMFTDPPLIQVGPPWSELHGDSDIVEVSLDLGSFPRATTDELPAGHLWVAARRSTGCLVAATGAGPAFDELSHALVTAIDGRIPVARLRQSMQPFPTVGEILGPAYDDLHAQLVARAG